MDAAPDCGEIWVAQGVYSPGRFVRRSSAALYGGFGGFETNREPRDWVTHPTFLSAFDFAYDTRPQAILDGFYVNGDPAGGSRILVRGCSPAIRNCVFTNSATQCLWIENNSMNEPAIEHGSAFEARPVIEHCVFAGNASHSIWCNSGSPAILDCLFTNNATAAIGNQSTPTISNCVFVANSAGVRRHKQLRQPADYPVRIPAQLGELRRRDL